MGPTAGVTFTDRNQTQDIQPISIATTFTGLSGGTTGKSVGKYKRKIRKREGVAPKL